MVIYKLITTEYNCSHHLRLASGKQSVLNPDWHDAQARAIYTARTYIKRSVSRGSRGLLQRNESGPGEGRERDVVNALEMRNEADINPGFSPLLSGLAREPAPRPSWQVLCKPQGHGLPQDASAIFLYQRICDEGH